MRESRRVGMLRVRSAILWPALAGVVSAAVLLAVAEALAVLVRSAASPLIAVGGLVIDIVPRPVKEFAIAAFGTADKPVLIGSLAVAAAVGAALAGILQWRRPPWGVVLLAAGSLGALAVMASRTGADALSLMPTAVGALAGGAVLVLLVRVLRRAESAVGSADGAAGSATATPSAEDRPLRPDRRRFFAMTAVAAAGAVVLAVGARVADGTRASLDAIRRALRLPAPSARVEVPAGAELDVPGISPLFTPNADFYRVDTALEIPAVEPDRWRLTVDGLVRTPFEIGFDDLIAMGLGEYAITLTCVSNEIGGDLVGTAKWWGVPVRDLLRRAEPLGGADMVLSHSVDGFTASTPLDALTDDRRDAILAVAMNGEPLPLEHGFPVRMVVPGLYGYVSATKWLTRLTVTTFADDQAYWTSRGYAAKAPIKFSSRLDTPRPGTRVAAGAVTLAGVAWAQTVGVERVEVRIDDGPWQTAALSTAVNADTWVQWMLPWQATTGTHYVTVRAVNRDGDVQIEDRAPIAPDGSTGWQRTLLTVD